MPPDTVLARLDGARLVHVEFVHDHLRLVFEGLDPRDQPAFTCLAMPTVRTRGGVRREGEPTYAGVLVALIGERVVATRETAEAGLEVELERGLVALRPEEDDLAGPEVAMLRGFDDGSLQVWRVGEDVFAYLADDRPHGNA